MSKDLLRDRYGRFYEIPVVLKKSGYEVFLACISYRDSSNHDLYEYHPFQYSHFRLGANPVYGMYRYYSGLCRIIREFQPDVIIGASDSFHIILAAMLSRKYKIPYIADLYDNFESYKATSFPGVRLALAAAVRNAHGISVVSDALRRFVSRNYKPDGTLVVIENAIVPELFGPADKGPARQVLKLPKDSCLIGTAGALYQERGIDIMFDVFSNLAKERDDVYLVLAGPIGTSVTIPPSERIIYLGELAHKDVPTLFNALDIGIICNVESEFGLYCFPQKAYEMLACKLPVVAANVGAISSLLENFPDSLYKPGDSSSLLAAIKRYMNDPQTINIEIPSWEDQAKEFGALIETVSANYVARV